MQTPPADEVADRQAFSGAPLPNRSAPSFRPTRTFTEPILRKTAYGVKGPPWRGAVESLSAFSLASASPGLPPGAGGQVPVGEIEPGVPLDVGHVVATGANVVAQWGVDQFVLAGNPVGGWTTQAMLEV